MKLRVHLVALLAISAISITACQPASTSSPVPCTETSTSARCILQLGQSTLDAVEDPFVWASSASELAIAYDQVGQAKSAEGLIEAALEKAKTIEDVKKRGTVFGEILTALAAMSKSEKASLWASEIVNLSPQLEDRAKADVRGKALIVQAKHVDAKNAFQQALELPKDQDVEGYAKAITLRKIANILAKNSDLETSLQAVNAITMSIDYYKSMARSDIARIAYKKSDAGLAQTLLDEADPIARSLGNGYFVGAALRDIGYSYQQMGNNEKALTYFSEALEATSQAAKQNEKARSTSRIATRMADAGLSSQVGPILEQAAGFADDIETQVMKSYSYYEIAGSAGISGQFDLARKWLAIVPNTPMGSTSSLQSAAQRDLAWGLMRFGNKQEALSVARNITSPREKIHALSRMVRVMQNPSMEALPRYL